MEAIVTYGYLSTGKPFGLRITNARNDHHQESDAFGKP